MFFITAEARLDDDLENYFAKAEDKVEAAPETTAQPAATEEKKEWKWKKSRVPSWEIFDSQ